MSSTANLLVTCCECRKLQLIICMQQCILQQKLGWMDALTLYVDLCLKTTWLSWKNRWGHHFSRMLKRLLEWCTRALNMPIKVLQKEPEGWPLTPEFMICYSSRNTIEKSSRSLLLKDNCILISGHLALTCNFISKAGDHYFIFQLFTKVQSTQLGVFCCVTAWEELTSYFFDRYY